MTREPRTTTSHAFSRKMSAQRSAASDENWASAASSLHSHAGFSAERTNSVGVFAATATVKQTAMRMEDEARSGRCAQ